MHMISLHAGFRMFEIVGLKVAGCRTIALTHLPVLLSLFICLNMLCPCSLLAQVQLSDDVSNDEFSEGTVSRSIKATEALPVELVEEKLSIPDTFKPKAKEVQQTSEELDIENGLTDAQSNSNEELNVGANNTKEAHEISSILNAHDLEISALIKSISKITKRNYIVDNEVKGKVTIHLPTQVTEEEALRIFDSVLLLKGYTSVPLENNVWKIIPVKDAKQTTIPFIESTTESEDADRSDTLVTELIRLRHTQAEDLQQLLSQFVGGSGVINSFSGTNTLLIIDSARNILRLKQLASQLDVPAVDQDITIIPILHAEAQDVAEKVSQIFDEKEDPASNAKAAKPSQMPRRSGGADAKVDASASSKSVDRRALPLKIIADERTNSIILIADPEKTVKVRALVERLDSEVDRSGGRFYVYQLKHADSEKLAEILNQVISGSTSTSNSSSATTGSSLSRSKSTNKSGNESTSGQTAAQKIAAAMRSRSNPQNPEGKVSFEGDITIAPDTSTNSLIINATRSDYLRIKEVIDLLDLKRRQVLVEATLVEVTLNEEEGLGVELQGSLGDDNAGLVGQTNWGGLTKLISNPAELSDLTIAAASTGTLTLPGGLVIPSQAVLVSALSSNSNVNVLSSPTILATDNEEAEIIVGENVPFVTSTSTDPTNLNNTFNQIERQDVGITLRITPQISTGDYVLLKIFIEISNVVTGTRDDPNGPTTTIRTTETTVEVKNSQMIITGGLIADSVTNSTRGVPYLEDIPVIGQLFQTDGKNARRTNLLVFLTPRIVSDQYEARDQTKAFAEKLENSVKDYGVTDDIKMTLKHPSMDNVAQESPVTDALAGTITPVAPNKLAQDASLLDMSSDKSLSKAPEKQLSQKEHEAVSKTKNRIEALLRDPASLEINDTTKGESTSKGKARDEIIDIVVSPSLPSVTTSKVRSAEINKIPTIKAAPIDVKQPVVLQSVAQTYVVLRGVDGDNDNKSGLPYADENMTLGLIVSGDDSAMHFKPGSKYAYQVSDKRQIFVCLGTFKSPDAASSVSRALKNQNAWHTLPPSDLATLGDKQWQKQ